VTVTVASGLLTLSGGTATGQEALNFVAYITAEWQAYLMVATVLAPYVVDTFTSTVIEVELL
jgi:hypothetical protein